MPRTGNISTTTSERVWSEECYAEIKAAKAAYKQEIIDKNYTSNSRDQLKAWRKAKEDKLIAKECFVKQKSTMDTPTMRMKIDSMLRAVSHQYFHSDEGKAATSAAPTPVSNHVDLQSHFGKPVTARDMMRVHKKDEIDAQKAGLGINNNAGAAQKAASLVWNALPEATKADLAEEARKLNEDVTRHLEEFPAALFSHTQGLVTDTRTGAKGLILNFHYFVHPETMKEYYGLTEARHDESLPRLSDREIFKQVEKELVEFGREHILQPSLKVNVPTSPDGFPYFPDSKSVNLFGSVATTLKVVSQYLEILYDHCHPDEDAGVPWNEIAKSPQSFYDAPIKLKNPATMGPDEVLAVALFLQENSRPGSATPFRFLPKSAQSAVDPALDLVPADPVPDSNPAAPVNPPVAPIIPADPPTPTPDAAMPADPNPPTIPADPPTPTPDAAMLADLNPQVTALPVPPKATPRSQSDKHATSANGQVETTDVETKRKGKGAKKAKAQLQGKAKKKNPTVSDGENMQRSTRVPRKVTKEPVLVHSTIPQKRSAAESDSEVPKARKRTRKSNKGGWITVAYHPDNENVCWTVDGKRCDAHGNLLDEDVESDGL